jgi:hypothetical protein
VNWTSHVHRCSDCGRRWECGDPDCDTGTVGGDLCGECESLMQFDFFCAREAAKTARRDPETDSTRQTEREGF